MENHKSFKLVLLFVCSLVTACGNDDGGNIVNEGDPDQTFTEYSFSVDGGEFDGTTFSGTSQDGAGAFIGADVSNSSQDEVHLNFAATTEQGVELGGDGTFLLNQDGEVLPVGDALEDIHSLSTLIITIEDGGETYLFGSKNGTASITGLEVGEWIGGTINANYELSFNEVFLDPFTGNEVNISGTFNTVSIE